tara:strand:- start:3691 stop:4251 length:561 start_codon:yes stop_codon:yes gene_type:complete
MSKNVLTYRVSVNQRDQYGYGHTYIQMTHRMSEQLLDAITDIIGRNGDAKPYANLRKMGYRKYLSSMPAYGGADVTLHWQHYDPSQGFGGAGDIGYCSHSISEISNLSEMVRGLKLLTKVSRKAAKLQDRYVGPSDVYSYVLDHPGAVVNALEAMGAVRIENPEGTHFLVPATSDAPAWRDQEIGV